MHNTVALTAHDLHNIFGERAKVPDYYASIGVSTDTRTMKPGCIFVALRGERFDAHSNIGEAIIKGAVCIVFEQRWLPEWESSCGKEFPKFCRVVVEDTLVALGEIARYHRKRFSIPVVAIAGANGKTTTKDMAAHLLSEKYITLKTQENFNNRVGVPHTLFQLTKFHQAAVIEIGTNEPGEIEILSNIVKPTHGVVTNIGEEHLEKLIDLDGVEKEETSLFRELQLHNGVALVNMDDDRLRACSTLNNSFTFSTEHEADLQVKVSFNDALQPNLNCTMSGQAFSATMQTVGYASALNAVAATAIALSVGMTTEEVCPRLENYTPEPAHGYARMIVESFDNSIILNDCYNANPSSMRMAFQTLRAFSNKGRKLAMIGDMRELGESTDLAHQEILLLAVQTADKVFVLGDDMATAANLIKNSSIILCSNHRDAAEKLRKELQPDDVVLVKASRGLALEKVLRIMKSE